MQLALDLVGRLPILHFPAGEIIPEESAPTNRQTDCVLSIECISPQNQSCVSLGRCSGSSLGNSHGQGDLNRSPRSAP